MYLFFCKTSEMKFLMKREELFPEMKYVIQMIDCDTLFEYLGIQLPGTESKDLHVTFLAASVYKYWTEGGPAVISLPLQQRVGSPSTVTGKSKDSFSFVKVLHT